ncbi:MAG: polyphosphate:AMP phosphotransferase [Verrucomicrobia bacterium]|nr:polyphosphate:AMP phosphotransferase [Verrucomicrobiota bacterium]
MNQEIRGNSQRLLAGEEVQGLSGKKYAKRLNKLRLELMKIQRKLQDTPNPIIIIIAGVDGAGKGQAIQLLNEWIDPRDLDTYSFWDLSDEALQRPKFWRYWDALPRRGKITIWFEGWYSDPLLESVHRRLSPSGLEDALKDIRNQERALADDGAVILKFWFHLTKSEQEKRLCDLYENPKEHWRAMGDDWKHHSLYERFETAATEIMGKTHEDRCPWFFVPSADPLERNLTFATLLSESLENVVRSKEGKKPAKVKLTPAYCPSPYRALAKVDLDQRLPRDLYEEQLVEAQSRLHRLFWLAYEKRISTSLVFEGWDAAGKGGAIRRATAAIDPRLYRIVQVGPPTLEEHSYHYLWRFWRDLPRDGRITIFDRSWYGRVLVERIEGFAKDEEWQRAYAEINEFEREMTQHGSVLLKFWIHISKEKQLNRFRSRQEIPFKQHKITDDDWRNRERWDDYEVAVNDMVAYTSGKGTAWSLVSGNNKRFARIQTIETICERLESALKARA